MNVDTITNFFQRCIARAEGINDDNVAHWDTNSVTDMSNMFQNCTNSNQGVDTGETQLSATNLGKEKLECMAYKQKGRVLYFTLIDKTSDGVVEFTTSRYWTIREDGEKIFFSREEIIDSYLAFLSNPVYSSGIKAEVRAQYLKDYMDIELAYDIVRRDPVLLLELHKFHKSIQEAIHGYTVIFFPDYGQKALVLGDMTYGDTLSSVLSKLSMETGVTHEVNINEALIEKKFALLAVLEIMLNASDQLLRLKLNKLLKDTDVTVDYYSDSTIFLSCKMDKLESMRKVLSQLNKLDIAIYDRSSSLTKEGESALLIYKAILSNTYVFKLNQETVEIVPTTSR